MIEINALEELLLRKGVKQEHILDLSNEKVKSDKVYRSFFDYDPHYDAEVLVPVNKIKGLTFSRGKENYSWWDHANMKAGNIDPHKFRGLQEKLEETTLVEFEKWFVDKNFPMMQLYYYEDFDEYYVGSDGNHRSIWAKLIDAKYIKAEIVKYRINHQRYEKYKLHEKEKQKNHEKIELLKKNFEKDIQDFGFTIKENNVEFHGELLVNYFPENIDLTHPATLKILEKRLANTANHLLILKSEYYKLKSIPSIIRYIYILARINLSASYNKRIIYEMLRKLYKKNRIKNIV
ncbi:hypothetical protein [Halobacillus mangrovi]|uniref:Uncharacterized protein n=1 Tax=Halobacillus mangrovi TaxID=402384 RepID=A0A1W5ZQW8_9BACI|nr:hypothetical protein [Halobacillus mangrovi]ARI75657.1 hypothetical protein HM131_01925 [Halobacillus mangrovi]